VKVAAGSNLYVIGSDDEIRSLVIGLNECPVEQVINHSINFILSHTLRSKFSRKF